MNMWQLRRLAVQPASRASTLGRLKHKFAHRAYRYLQQLVGFSIPAGAQFAGEPTFPHGVAGVYISSSAEIGHDCVIFHHVTIGSNTLLDSKGLGAPVIGDSCYIGVGAKIIGGVIIGEGARIAANAVVTRDVPAYATVVGTNQIIESSEPRDNRFFSYYRNRWVFYQDAKRMNALPEDVAKLEKVFSKKRI